MIVLRILSTLVLIISVVFLPWYVQFILGAIACFLFYEYYEFLFVAMLFSIVSGSLYIPLVAAAAAILFIEYIKKGIILYRT